MIGFNRSRLTVVGAGLTPVHLAMIGLSLSDNTRAAALDGALSFSVLLHNQRELTLASAQSGVTGLIHAIRSAPDNYAQVVAAASGAAAALESASARLTEPAWGPASTSVRNAIADAIHGALPEDEEAAAAHPFHPLAGVTPSTWELTSESPPPLYLSTWGQSGALSLTQANGSGVLIWSDGRVDALPLSGEGWKFATASTFLLPDGTKLSISPGAPGGALVTRGELQLLIEPLGVGVPAEPVLSATGGLDADAAWNDGHLFTMGATPRFWTLAGTTLGQLADEREVVATAALTHEHPLDVTKIPLPAELAERLAALHLDPAAYDRDGDGRFSQSELLPLLQELESAVGGAQSQFEAALAQTAGALEPLLRLTQFMQKALAEVDRQQTDRAQQAGAEQDQLRQIQRDLDAARTGLLRDATVTSPPAPPPEPRVVLNAPAPSSTAVADSPGSSDLPTGAAPTSTRAPADPMASPPGGPARLRRAERLLSAPGSGPKMLGPNLHVRPNLASEPTDPELLAAIDRQPPLPDDPVPDAGDLPPASDVVLPQGPSRINPRPAPPAPVTIAVGPATVPPPLPGRQHPTPVPVLRSTPNEPPAPAAVPPATALANAQPGTEPATRPSIPSPASGPGRREVTPPSESELAADAGREIRRRTGGHLALHREHVGRMRQLQTELREVVATLLTLVQQDDHLRTVVQAEEGAEDQRGELKARLVELEHELGLSWGGEVERTPHGEARLHARVLASGMMI